MSKPTISFACKMTINVSAQPTESFMKSMGIAVAGLSNNSTGTSNIISVDMEVQEEPVDVLEAANSDVYVVDIAEDRLCLPPMRLKVALNPGKWGGQGGFASANALIANNINLAGKKLHKVVNVWPYSMCYQIGKND